MRKIFFIIFISILFLVSCKTKESKFTKDSEKIYKKVLSIAQIGFNIDKVRELLIKEGVNVWEKECPTGEYYICSILLEKKIPIKATINEVTGKRIFKSGGKVMWIHIEADLNNKITDIYYQ